MGATQPRPTTPEKGCQLAIRCARQYTCDNQLEELRAATGVMKGKCSICPRYLCSAGCNSRARQLQRRMCVQSAVRLLPRLLPAWPPNAGIAWRACGGGLERTRVRQRERGPRLHASRRAYWVHELLLLHTRLLRLPHLLLHRQGLPRALPLLLLHGRHLPRALPLLLLHGRHMPRALPLLLLHERHLPRALPVLRLPKVLLLLRSASPKGSVCGSVCLRQCGT